jgi:tetratricopeptide (TPR) repeat protein
VLNLPEQHATDDAVRVDAALAWLNRHPGWLLILDNVDSAEAMTQVERLMGTLRGGAVLVTTRRATSDSPLRRVEVDVLSQEEAAVYLLEHTDRYRQRTSDDAAEARRLAADLGGLPLALEQASAYVAAHRLTFARYRQLWRNDWERLAASSDATSTYPRSVLAATRLSIDQLSPDARILLEGMAFLAPDPIPESLLEVQSGWASLDVGAALLELDACKLVRRNAEMPQFSIHPLLQAATRYFMPEGKSRSRLADALDLMDAAFSGDPQDVRAWPHLEPLAPHAHALVRHADAAGLTNPTAHLMNRLARMYHTKALYAEAEALFRRTLAIYEKEGRDPDVAANANDLATLLRETNRPVEAEALIRRALEIDRRSDSPANLAADLSNLAQLLRATGRASEAEPLYREAVMIAEKVFGPDHPSVAPHLNNLASLLRDANRSSEAEPLIRRALVIAEKSRGPDHPDIATYLNNLAGLLHNAARSAEGKPLVERALAIVERNLGPDHPAVAISLNNLAALLQDIGRHADAGPLIRRAHEIDEKAFGPSHPEVAMDLNNLASWLEAGNRHAEAEPLYRRALAILARFSRETGHQHPEFARVRAGYAQLLTRMGYSDAAISAMLERLLENPRPPD